MTTDPAPDDAWAASLIAQRPWCACGTALPVGFDKGRACPVCGGVERQ